MWINNLLQTCVNCMAYLLRRWIDAEWNVAEYPQYSNYEVSTYESHRFTDFFALGICLELIKDTILCRTDVTHYGLPPMHYSLSPALDRPLFWCTYVCLCVCFWFFFTAIVFFCIFILNVSLTINRHVHTFVLSSTSLMSDWHRLRLSWNRNWNLIFEYIYFLFLLM